MAKRKMTKGQTTTTTKYSTENKKLSNMNATKNRGELRYSGRIDSSCSTSDTRRVTLATNPVINHE
jgi:ribosomal protein L32